MRKYEKVVTTKSYRFKSLNRGLKKVNIGEDVWLVGKQKHVPGKGMHCVIYGPDRKTEHHVWGKDVEWICTEIDPEWNAREFANVNRHGNRALEQKVKIYILTSILDNRENWCFDLEKVPAPGKLKVVYHNGTVKNIDFDGTFRPGELVSKRFTWEPDNRYNMVAHTSMKFVNPVAYRLK